MITFFLFSNKVEKCSVCLSLRPILLLHILPISWNLYTFRSAVVCFALSMMHVGFVVVVQGHIKKFWRITFYVVRILKRILTRVFRKNSAYSVKEVHLHLKVSQMIIRDDLLLFTIICKTRKLTNLINVTIPRLYKIKISF